MEPRRDLTLDGEGGRVGRYRILQHIGAGGMGEVYLAEQREPVRRRVALKVIRTGLDTDQIRARFEAERQALAMMEHPSIAKIFDAGIIPDGRPYFVMEYVDGVSITEHCDRYKLGTRERLELIKQVCGGVFHAHQRAVIHRDLKPSNVLITLRDGKPVPKIIDFGVAKALNQQLSDHTLFTRVGHLVGTPAYMSPEQATMSNQGVDTRTDVYSLGVLMYELLSGALPIDPRDLQLAGAEAIRQKLWETDIPRPSTRLQTDSDQMTAAARDRSTEPGALIKELQGELDWIVLRAVEKDITRRYSSAQELSSEISRYLNNEPVLACPPSLAYRLRKLLSRYRMQAAAAAAVAFVLVAGSVSTSVMFLRAERQRDLADERREEAVSALKTAQLAGYRGQIIAADQFLRDARVDTARDLLEATPKELRGWEWQHLWFKSDASVDRVVFSGEDDPRSLRFAPQVINSGNQLFREVDEGQFELWDTTTRAASVRWELPDSWLKAAREYGNSARFRHAIVGPDEKRVAIMSSPGGVGVWDLRDGTLLLDAMSPYAHEILLSPTGNRLFVMEDGRKGETATVWDIESKRVLDKREHVAFFGAKWLDDVAISLTSPGRGDSCLGDVWLPSRREFIELASVPEHRNYPVWRSVCEQRASRASDSNSHGLISLNPASIGQLTDWVPGRAETRRCADDGAIAVFGRNQFYPSWRTAHPLLSEHPIRDAFPPCNGLRAITVSMNPEAISYWDPADGWGENIGDSRSDISSLAFGLGPGKMVISSGQEPRARILDLHNPDRSVALESSYRCTDVIPSVDRSRAFSSRCLKAWSATTGNMTVSFPRWNWWAYIDGSFRGYGKLSPSLDQIAYPAINRQVYLWPLRPGRPAVKIPGREAWPTHLSFSPSGQRLVVVYEDGQLVVSDARSGMEQFQAGGVRQESIVAFNQQESLMAVVGKDQSLRVYRTEEADLLFEIPGAADEAGGMAFLEAGGPARLVVARSDQSLSFYSLPEGELVGIVQRVGSRISVSEDGRSIAAWSRDGAQILHGWRASKPDARNVTEPLAPPLPKNVERRRHLFITRAIWCDERGLMVELPAPGPPEHPVVELDMTRSYSLAGVTGCANGVPGSAAGDAVASFLEKHIPDGYVMLEAIEEAGEGSRLSEDEREYFAYNSDGELLNTLLVRTGLAEQR